MDPEELKRQEFDRQQRQAEYEQRDRHHAEQLRSSRLTAMVGVIALCSTVVFTTWQVTNSTRQFRASSRASEYSQIIDGLASSATAVQASSMRRLTDFVGNEDNFPTPEAHALAVQNALDTLTAFIEDKSTTTGRPGLSDYQVPEPIIVPRAMSRLVNLIEDPALGIHVVDVSRANLHGVSLLSFEPTGHVYAPAVDLRRASLAGLDLRVQPGGTPSTLSAAFLTCADLTNAKLGPADVAAADFTGADLSGADLSQVTGLEPDQLRGTTMDERTLLPLGMPVKERTGWHGTQQCFHLVNDMTGMRGAQGYVDTIPCPTTMPAAKRIDFEPPWRGSLKTLVRACTRRARAP